MKTFLNTPRVANTLLVIPTKEQSIAVLYKTNSSSIRVIWYAVFLLPMLAMLFTGIQFSFAQIPFSIQPEKAETRSGNKEYKNENFSEAEANYKKALDIK